MPIHIRRLNASTNDLKPEQVPEHQKILEVFKMIKPVVRPIERAALIQLHQDFGAQKVLAMMERWAMLGYNSIDTLHDMLTGAIPSERSAKPKVNEMPGADRARGSGDFKSVGDVVKTVAPVKYPTADHIYDEPAAGVWMRNKGHNVNNYREYFDMVQERPIFLFQLKSEYR